MDFVKPEWNYKTSSINGDQKTVEIQVTASDNNYLESGLNESNVKVLIDNVEKTEINKQITKISTTKTAETYKIVLSNFGEESGFTQIKIGANSVKDTSGNGNTEKIINVGNPNGEEPFKSSIVDFIKPEVNKISSTVDSVNKTEKIVFTVTDKYFKSSDINKENIIVKVDGDIVTDLTRDLTVTDLTEQRTVNGITSTVKYGEQYTLVLSEFQKNKYNKEYLEWSGNVTIEIPEKLVKDTSNNTNDKSGIKCDFVDFIKPQITYKYSNTTIDKTNKTLNVVFEVREKYFSSCNITDQDISIVVDGDSSANEKVQKTLTKQETILDNVNGEIRRVGERYSLLIEHLEQAERNPNDKTKDYSGIVQLLIKSNIAKDTSNNYSDGKTITVGIDDPESSENNQGVIVDLVDPIWEIQNPVIENNELKVDLIGTDKYFKEGALTTDNIKIFIDDEEVTSSTNVLKTLSSVENLSETVDGKTVQYGIKYKLTLSNFEEALKQNNKLYKEYSGNVKIKIDENTLSDKYDNFNKKTSLNVKFVDFIKPQIEKISSSINK